MTIPDFYIFNIFKCTFQLFEVMDENKDMSLSWEEIYKVDILSLIMDFPFILSDITPEELDALQEAYPSDSADDYDDQFRDEL